MRTVYKYPVPVGPLLTVNLPQGAKIVLAAIDPASGGPAIWVEQDTDRILTQVRRFVIHATGDNQIMPNELHVGSMIDRNFVWHVYELAQ